MLTLNQIISQITDLANAHYQIAEVGTGTLAELQSKPDRLYPLLWLSNEGGSLDQNYKIDNIRLTMFGRVIAGEEGQDDDASELEVLSDMQLILLDFLNYFHQQHGQEYVTDKAATLEHFTERTNDRTAGYSCVLELKQFYDWNKCQIPQSGASIPPSVDGLTLYDFCDQSVIDRLTATQVACLEAELCGACADATVQINGTTVGTIASGDTDSFPVTQGGSPVGSWNGSAWIVPPCAAATVHNSDNSYSTTVASGGDLSLPNITFTDSDGSSSSVPSVQDITATPCTTTPSLSVAVSDDNPDIGDTITITATPTGLSGTVNYYYQARKGTEIVVIGSNTIGTIDWDVSLSGEIEIYVEADDGTNGTFNVDGEALTANATVIVTGLELWLDPFRSNIVAPTYPDISGNGRDGTLVNSPTVVAGDLTAGNGGYVDFNGTDQYVQSIGGTADFSFIQNTLTFTIMGFVKINDLTNRNLWLGNTATSSEKGFYLYDCKTSGSEVEAIEMQILCGNGSGTIYVINSDNNVISTNDWYHIAITCNSGISQIYVNGVAVNTTVASNAFTIPTGSSNRTLSMGKVTGFAIYHDGKIAPIQIYNYGLTQAQVEQNFDADKARYGL